MHYEVSQDADFFNMLAGIKLNFKVAAEGDGAGNEGDQIQEAGQANQGGGGKYTVKNFDINIVDFKEGEGGDTTMIEKFKKKAKNYLTQYDKDADILPPDMHSKVAQVEIVISRWFQNHYLIKWWIIAPQLARQSMMQFFTFHKIVIDE